ALEALPESPVAAARSLLAALAACAQPQTRLAPLQRPRMAYVSPMPPVPSGIADYSAELLPALREYYDIDVIIAQSEPPGRGAEGLAVRDAGWFDAHAHGYDRVVYHFGNSPYHAHMVGLLRRHPGVVVLHDFFL